MKHTPCDTSTDRQTDTHTSVGESNTGQFLDLERESREHEKGTTAHNNILMNNNMARDRKTSGLSGCAV